MPRFLVKTPVEHDGNPYPPGSFVVLTEAQAKAMPWAVEAAPEPVPEKTEPKKAESSSKSSK